jgi:hypothetical protein
LTGCEWGISEGAGDYSEPSVGIESWGRAVELTTRQAVQFAIRHWRFLGMRLARVFMQANKS